MEFTGKLTLFNNGTEYHIELHDALTQLPEIIKSIEAAQISNSGMAEISEEVFVLVKSRKRPSCKVVAFNPLMTK
jgi:hypothetical protein